MDNAGSIPPLTKKRLVDASEVEVEAPSQYTPQWLAAQVRKEGKFYSKVTPGRMLYGHAEGGQRLKPSATSLYYVCLLAALSYGSHCWLMQGGIRSMEAVTGSGPLHYFLVSLQNDRIMLP